MTIGEVTNKISLISGIIASILLPLTTVSLLITDSAELGSLFLYNLSDLGKEGEQTAGIFNLTITIGGGLALLFAIGLGSNMQIIGRSGFVLFTAAAIALTCVGIFNLPDPIHNLSALSFFGLLPIALLVMGLHIIRSGSRNTDITRPIGYGTVVSGVVILALAFLMMAFYPEKGLAMLELAIMFTSSFWVLVFGRKLLMPINH